MYKFKIILFALCLSSTFNSVMAKTSISIYSIYFQSKITGKIVNTKNEPISYANIGVLNGNRGTVTDKDGNFELISDSLQETDIIKISAIGYEDLQITLSDFINKGSKMYVLQNEKLKTKNIEEIVLTKQNNFKTKAFGITSSTRSVRVGFRKGELGQEIATYVKNSKNIKLKSLDINVIECTFDTTPFRLNIYEAENGVYKNILEENIFINVDKKKNSQKISIDLSSYKIILDKDFVISLELIENKSDGELYFSGSIFSKGLVRKTSQSKFEPISINPSISVIAEILK